MSSTMILHSNHGEIPIVELLLSRYGADSAMNVDRMPSVYIMDLLCQSPHYDSYLYQHVVQRLSSVRFGSISFERDMDYYTRQGVTRDRRIVDVVSRIGVQNTGLRRVLKTIEYHLNLALVAVRFLIRPPDVVHTQWLPLVGLLPTEYWFLKLLKARNIALVHTAHNVTPHDDSKNRMKMAYGRVYNLVDRLIVHTSVSRQRLVSEYGIPTCKVTVVPHGPMFGDQSTVSGPESRISLGYAESETLVLFFGSIRPYKGVEFLLESWSKVAARDRGARLIIAGGGDETYLDRIRIRVRESGLSQSVDLRLGYQPVSVLIRLHESADIVVCPYRDIDQSGALLTAMAFGKAVVATDVGGFSETIQHGQNGCLVQYGDAEELAVTLNHLISEPCERVRLGLNALAETETIYAWASIANRTISCYEDASRH